MERHEEAITDLFKLSNDGKYAIINCVFEIHLSNCSTFNSFLQEYWHTIKESKKLPYNFLPWLQTLCSCFSPSYEANSGDAYSYKT